MSSEDSEYVCTLDAASIKKAKDELNEIPEDRLAAVQAFRDWIKAQPHLNYPATDTVTLLLYLRSCKFSQIKAREKLEENLKLRKDFPKHINNTDGRDAVYRKLAESGYMTVLPKRTPEGCLILVQKMEYFQKLLVDDKIPMELFSKFGQLVFYKYLVMDEMTQVNGMVFLVDFHGLTASALPKFLTKESGQLQKAWQKASPGRFKGFHYYRPGVFFETIMAAYKPFLSKKWIERIKVHTTMESIYKVVPKECLPLEFLPDDYTGPNAGSMAEITKGFTDAVLNEENIQEVRHLTSDVFWIDESKKPAEQVTQHFRKLNVD